MGTHETHLEMALRHVAQGEARVARQAALVAELAQQGRDTVGAETLLATMEDTLQLMRKHLDLELEHETNSSITNLMRGRGWRWWPAAGRQDAQERMQRLG